MTHAFESTVPDLLSGRFKEAEGGRGILVQPAKTVAHTATAVTPDSIVLFHFEGVRHMTEPMGMAAEILFSLRKINGRKAEMVVFVRA